MKIGIYGSAAGLISDEVREKAREIGRQIAQRGHTIITGGCSGLPYEAVLGAQEFKGNCIAYSPAVDIKNHVEAHNFPVEGFSKFIFVPKEYIHANNPTVCKKYRNVSSVAAADAVIIIGGRIGTMNEFTIAYDLGKNIGVLKDSGGITKEAIKVLLSEASKESKSKTIYNSNPASLVDELLKS